MIYAQAIARKHAFLVIAICCFSQMALSSRAVTTVLSLQNGDQVTGTLVGEDVESLKVLTAWGDTVSIPSKFVVARTIASSNGLPEQKILLLAPAKNHAAVTQGSKPKDDKPARRWQLNMKFGSDMVVGDRERQLYYGEMSLHNSFLRSAGTNQFIKNRLEYRVDYARAKQVVSANRMTGSDKTDFDVGRDWFLYSFGSGSFDEVRKIDAQYEAGVGAGYHLLRFQDLSANLESGLTYQIQRRAQSREIDALYGRFGQDVNWKPHPRVTMTQRSSLLMRTDLPSEFQLRTEANVAFGILKMMSFNVTALDLYDTHPVDGVSGNEFQLRSSIGLTF